MGMSASQARLLTLTSRLHDIEYKQQALSNTKMRLATESDAISQKYTNALNKQKFQFKNTQSNSYVNMTLKNLYAPGSKYTLKNASGQTCVPQSIYNMYKALVNQSTDPNSWANSLAHHGGKVNPSENADLFNAFMATKFGNVGDMANKVFAALGKDIQWGRSDEDYAKACAELGGNGGNFGTWQALVKYAQENNVTTVALPTLEEVNYYESMFKQFTTSAATNGAKNSDGEDIISVSASNLNDFAVISDDKINDANWLYEAIESGQFMLCNASGAQVSTASETSIDETYDDKDTAKAKAEYDAETNKLNRKEKVIDNQMKTLDTEYSATKTEFDSVKQIISDHASKDFELFG